LAAEVEQDRVAYARAWGYNTFAQEVSMHLPRSCVLLLLSVMAGWFTPTALAQNRPTTNPQANTVLLPEPPNQLFPSMFKPSFQWNYVCPRENAAAGCSLACPPNAAIGSVIAAQVWLGTNELGNAPIPAIYYYFAYFNGREKLAGAGFSQSPRNLSCQVVGLNVSYSGPPK
jgi:hypothetical protein